jgi:drug/metabolite transporter (DMT)-like permease
MKKLFNYTGLVMAMLFWAFTFIWAKQILNTGISPSMLVFLRLTSVTLFLLPAFLIFKIFRKVQKKDIGMFLLMAFFEPFLYFIGEANGIRLVSPNIASIIIATIPLFLPFFARLLIKERLNMVNFIGIGVSFTGVLLIIIDKGGRISASPEGLLYLFMAVFSAVAYTLIAKRMLARYSPFHIAGLKIMIAWIYFIPVFFIFDYSDFHMTQLTQQVVILVFALGIFGNLLAYFFFNNAIKHIGATKSSIFSNLIPVFTIMISFVILHEMMHIIKLSGICLTLCGIYISQIRSFRQRKPKTGQTLTIN